MKHIALLAGSYREFNGWIGDMIGADNSGWERTARMFRQRGAVYHFVDSDRDVRGLPVTAYETIGSFFEREDAHEILDATKARVFSNNKAEGFAP